MQAITTKFISPTNTRPARIKAACERGSLTMQWPHGVPTDAAHACAAQALCAKFADEDAQPAKYSTRQEDNPWMRPLVSGTIIGGLYVHVFAAK